MSGKIIEIEAASFRREVLEHEGPVVVDFFSTECPPCEALAPKFEAMSVLYGDDAKFVKIFRQGNRELATELAVQSSPTVLFYSRGKEIGRRLTGGIKRAELMAGLEACLPASRVAEARSAIAPVDTSCDVLILGGGPAGLTAGIYASQSKLRTMIVDVGLGGGHLAITHQISNWPGYPAPQPGYALAHGLIEHAKAAGVTMRLAADVTLVDLERKQALIDGFETIQARTLLVATGSSPRPLGVPGELEHSGKGISYCATCDAKYYEGKHVVVIGGGNSAIEESLFIAKFASKITIVHQFAELQANKQAQEKAFADPKISFVFEHEPREFQKHGTGVDAVLVENLRTGERHVIGCDGVFIFAGMKPNLDLFPSAFALDDFGYIKADGDMHTSVPGVFAAGDVVSKRIRQMTTAVADGTIAAVTMARELGA